MSSARLILLERMQTEQREQARKHKEETMTLSEQAHLLELNLLRQQKDEMQTCVSQNFMILEEGTRKEDEAREAEREANETREAESKEDVADFELTINALTVKGEQDAKELADARTMAAEIMKAVSTEEAKQLIAATPRNKKRKLEEPVIGFKRVGSIDEGPWSLFFRRKYASNWQLKMAQELSTWDCILRNPEFRPFKNVKIGKDQWKLEIDEQDQQLSFLRKNYDVQVYKSVTTALMEMEEYNGSGRYPVSHAWNFDESRIVSLKEVFAHLGSVMKAFLAGTETPPSALVPPVKRPVAPPSALVPPVKGPVASPSALFPPVKGPVAPPCALVPPVKGPAASISALFSPVKGPVVPCPRPSLRKKPPLRQGKINYRARTPRSKINYMITSSSSEASSSSSE